MYTSSITPRSVIQAMLVSSFVFFMFSPIIATLLSSLNSSEFVGFPIREWSFRWYKEVWNSRNWIEAGRNSLVVAVSVAALSTIVGTLYAYGCMRLSPKNRQVAYFTMMLPLFMPGIIIGLGTAVTFGSVQIAGIYLTGNIWLLVMAHCLWTVPISFMVMEASFNGIDPTLSEASADLGASPQRTFLRVVLPQVFGGIFGAFIFSFAVSLNEFSMALFLTNRGSTTIPVLMWSALRSATTPTLAVVAIGLAIISLALTILLAVILSAQRKGNN